MYYNLSVYLLLFMIRFSLIQLLLSDYKFYKQKSENKFRNKIKKIYFYLLLLRYNYYKQKIQNEFRYKIEMTTLAADTIIIS